MFKLNIFSLLHIKSAHMPGIVCVSNYLIIGLNYALLSHTNIVNVHNI